MCARPGRSYHTRRIKKATVRQRPVTTYPTAHASFLLSAQRLARESRAAMSHGATRHRPNLTVKPECTVTLACQCLQSHEQVNSARYNSRSRLGQSRFLPYGQSPRERTQRKERKQRQRFSSSAAGNPANSAAGNSVTAGTYPLGGTTAMSVEEGDIMYRYAPYEYNDVNIRVKP